MELIVMRHGHAEALATADAERALTKRGRHEVECVARALRRLGVRPTTLVASPYVRAQQSASIVSSVFDEIEITTNASLVPEARVDETLRGLPRSESLFLVSHMPLVSEILGRTLCGGTQSALPLMTSCAVVLEISHAASRDGRLVAALSPRVAEGLAQP